MKDLKFNINPRIASAAAAGIILIIGLVWYFSGASYSFSEENTFIESNSSALLVAISEDISQAYTITELSDSRLTLEVITGLPELEFVNAIPETETVSYTLNGPECVRISEGNEKVIARNLQSLNITAFNEQSVATKETEKMVMFGIYAEFLYPIKGVSTPVVMQTKAFSRYLLAKRKNPGHFSFIDDNRRF